MMESSDDGEEGKSVTQILWEIIKRCNKMYKRQCLQKYTQDGDGVVIVDVTLEYCANVHCKSQKKH